MVAAISAVGAFAAGVEEGGSSSGASFAVTAGVSLAGAGLPSVAFSSLPVCSGAGVAGAVLG